MRLFFISTETRPIVGGIAQCLDAWLTGLSEQGHTVMMLSLLPAAGKIGDRLPPRPYREEWLTLPERRSEPGDGFIPLRKARSARFIWKRDNLIRGRFMQLTSAFQPDWVVYSVLNPVCCATLPESGRRGLHCAGIAYGAEINPVRVTNPRWLRSTLRRIDRLIAISDFTRRKLEGWGVPDRRIAVVHPGLSESPEVEKTLKGRSEPETCQVDTRIRLLTICRLVERKGVHTVLAAIAQLRSEFPSLCYDVVGDGPYRGELERTAAGLGLQGTVTFHGLLSDEQRDAMLRACDIFVMVPFEMPDGDVEGFGIVYLEAGRYAKPVIGSRSGGVPDAVRHQRNGLLVPPGDVQGTAAAIGELASRPSRRAELGAKGREWARAHCPDRCGSAFVEALGST